MQIRLELLVATLASCMIAGCHANQAIPSTPESFVGGYIYKSTDTSVDRATDHELDRLTLQANGRYVLVQGGSTKAKADTAGVWHLVGGDPPNVELDHHGYPIRVEGNEIRLLINDDLGEWYAKTK